MTLGAQGVPSLWCPARLTTEGHTLAVQVSPGQREDPGWLSAARRVPVGLVWYFRPAVLLRKSPDRLVAMRTVVLMWALIVIVAGTMLIWIADSAKSSNRNTTVGIVFALVAIALCGAADAVIERQRRRRLTPSALSTLSAEAVAMVFQHGFFLRGLLSNAAAAGGFTAMRLQSGWFGGVMGIVAGGVGLALTAPTASRVRRFQQDLRNARSTVDLLVALQTAPEAPLLPSR